MAETLFAFPFTPFGQLGIDMSTGGGNEATFTVTAISLEETTFDTLETQQELNILDPTAFIIIDGFNIPIPASDEQSILFQISNGINLEIRKQNDSLIIENASLLDDYGNQNGLLDMDSSIQFNTEYLNNAILKRSVEERIEFGEYVAELRFLGETIFSETDALETITHTRSEDHALSSPDPSPVNFEYKFDGDFLPL